MHGEPKTIEGLLDNYEEQVARGIDVAAEELCKECPELLPEFNRRIERLKKVNEALGIDSTVRGESEIDSKWHAHRTDPSEPLPGGRFRPHRLHAKGGLGEVYIAQDVELDREVALKLMQPAQARFGSSRRRFEQEAMLTGRLEHPGVVPVYGLGKDAKGNPVYAMRFIRGETLAAAIAYFHKTQVDSKSRSSNLALQQLLRHFLTACQTVAYAHSRGIVHRDIKPQNIMLGKFGETLLVDWGLAKVVEDQATESARIDLSVLRSALDVDDETLQGVVKGSPAYMSPEQADGRVKQIGPATDVYGLGATLYQILVGKPPFSGSSDEVLEQVRSGRVAPIRSVAPSTPQALEAICQKAMHKDADQRYASAHDLADEMERYLADEPVKAFRDPWQERARRWARRHRSFFMAAISSLLIGFAVLGVAAIMLTDAYQKESEARALADDRADQLQNSLVLNQFIFAKAALREDDPATAMRILESTPADQRRFEWRWLRGRALAPQELQIDQLDEISRLAVSGNGQVLAVAGTVAAEGADAFAAERGATIVVVDRKLNAVTHLLQREQYKEEFDLFPPRWNSTGPVSEIRCLALSPDGDKLAAVFGQRTPALVVWDTASGQVLWSGGAGRAIHAAQFADDGAVVVTAQIPALSPEMHAQFQRWDAVTGDTLPTVEGLAVSAVDRVDMSPDASHSAWLSSRRDSLNRISIVATDTGEATPLTGSNGAAVSMVAFSPNGKYMATAVNDHSIHLWNAEGQRVATLSSHEAEVLAVAFSADSKQLASAGRDHAVHIWDLAQLDNENGLIKPVRSRRVHDRFVNELAFLQGGNELISVGSDAVIRTWDLAATALAPVRREIQISAWDSSANGESVATIDDLGNVVHHDGTLTNARRTWQIPVAERALTKNVHVAINASGTVVAAATSRGLRIWNTDSGELVLGMDDVTGSIAFSTDGQHLYCRKETNRGSKLVLLDVNSGEQRAEWPISAKQIAQSPNQNRIAVVHSSGVTLLDRQTNTQVKLDIKNHSVRAIAVQPSGSLLATAGDDKLVRIWDADGTLLRSLQGHTDEVTDVCFHPAGDRLATCSYDSTIRIWDVRTGLLLETLRDSDLPYESVRFSEGGKCLLAAIASEVVLVYDTLPLAKQGAR